MELTKKLISLRKENGLSQAALAEQMDVARQTVYRWESGEAVPTPDNLRRLSELYDVSIGCLIDDGVELPSAAVAVMERPEAGKAQGMDLRKLILIGAIIVFVALLSYFAGYDKGTQDTTPTYSILTDTLGKENLEGDFDINSLSIPPANVLGEEELEGTFDLTTQ